MPANRRAKRRSTRRSGLERVAVRAGRYAEIIRHAGRGPLNALPPSIAAELIRERKDGLTTLERLTHAGRWGEEPRRR